MTRSPASALVLALLVACGDDAALDAGQDSGTDAPVDQGTDAVPDARPPFDGGADAPFDIFDSGGAPLNAHLLCAGDVEAPPYPEPGSWVPNRGPGTPINSFEESALYENCAYLDGGAMDRSDHHNLVTMYDGYLLMPWAPEWGGGGLTFFDISDACAPVAVGTGYSANMRETHSVGFSHEGGAWAVTASMGGILRIGEGGVQFWDISDTSAPEVVSDLFVPGYFYPDAYSRIIMSNFWQAPYVYLGAGFNGLYIVDAADPTSPILAAQYNFEPPMRVGQVQAVGTLLIVSATSGARTVLLDISDPLTPKPIAGGDFLSVDGAGEARDSYFSNFNGGFVYYARKHEGGGLLTMNVLDPTRPFYGGDLLVGGSGGYVFVHHERAFVGMGGRAAIFDISDRNAITEIAELHLEGDLDTFTPIGHLGVLSVDADANENQGSAIVPVALEPDGQPPAVNFVWPSDGADDVSTSARVGATVDEFLDVRSAFAGSVRLYETESGRRVDGVVSAQEGFVNFHPRCALRAATSYTFELTAGGLSDFAGNAMAETFRSEFVTAP